MLKAHEWIIIRLSGESALGTRMYVAFVQSGHHTLPEKSELMPVLPCLFFVLPGLPLLVLWFDVFTRVKLKDQFSFFS